MKAKPARRAKRHDPFKAAAPAPPRPALYEVKESDALKWLAGLPDDSADLLVTSPPYEDARLYSAAHTPLVGQAWVDWMVECVRAGLRVTKGPVVFVVEGRTRKYRWSATPALLMADLHRAGVHLRKPPAYARRGIFGGGGPDYFRNDYEFCVVATRGGRLPWSCPTACGHPPLYPPGGPPSHRKRDGSRVSGVYTPPALANPGNVISGKVGGGHLGHELSHECDAPMPLWLALRFARTFCPPGGTVIDPFAGSGTTGHAAIEAGQFFRGCDNDPEMVALALRRLGTVTPPMF
jgi:site-specific DNA-methyltransferase (adenine-specific)